MRKRLILATLAVALCSGAANASTIVQSISGSQRTPGSITLFDPTLGTLNAVTVQGVDGLTFGLIRQSLGAPLPAVSVPHSTSESLTLNGNAVIATNPITGNETYADGSMFGSMVLSGDVFSLFTGAAVDAFIANGQPAVVVPLAVLISPEVGSRYFSPGDVFTYSIQVSYDYTPLGAVPELSAWAMMMLGFAGIGVVARRTQLSFEISRERSQFGSRAVWPAERSTRSSG